MGLLETLVLGGYLFTAGAYVYIWRVEHKTMNHLASRVKRIESALGIAGLDKLTEE